MAVYNPRFPYYLQVLRPSEDKYGSPVFDDRGEAIRSGVTFKVAEYANGMPKRVKGVLQYYKTSEIPYGYRQQTANALTSGDVLVTKMKIACPLIIGEIKAGDVLRLTDSDRTFEVTVVKKVNTNFGTNIWYDDIQQ